MVRDLKRERLLAKLYSREGSTAAARDYVDPASGEVLHITPFEWELLQYDRAHDRNKPFGSSRPMVDPGTSVGHDGRPDADDSVVGEEPPPEKVRTRHPSVRTLAIGAALVVAGCLAGVALAIGVGHVQPGLIGLGGRPTAAGPINEIRAVFTSGDFAASDPGDLASIGFDRDSFRIVGDEVVYDRTGQIYAAHRKDGEYCLVLVSGLARVAETCATSDGIGSDGLTMKDTTREGDGSLLTFTAQWNRNGQLTWNLVETSH